MVTGRSPTVLYDGECNLCIGAVDFIRKQDHAGRYRFVPLGEAEAQDLLGARDGGCDTLHLLDEEGTTTAPRLSCASRQISPSPGRFSGS